MGNAHNDSSIERLAVSSRRHISQPFRLQDWLLRQKKADYDIYKHRRLNQQIQIYTIDVASNDDLSVYEMRKSWQIAQIPRVVHYELLNNHNKMIRHHNNKYVRVMLERIPIRLSQLKEITFKPVETLLYETLEGYQIIYSRHGPIRVTADMIGFTAEGMTKVWLNSNFARNQPNNGDKLQSVAENYLVESIFSIYQQFLKGMCNDRKKYMTFNQAFQYLKDRINRKQTLTMSLEKHGQILAYEQSQPIMYQNEAVRNIQPRQQIRPINYILVRNAPKKMHIDLSEQRNNISGTSQPSQKIADLSNTQIKTTDINCINNNTKLEPQMIATLNQSRGTTTYISNPRNAINQLSGLGGGHSHSNGFQTSQVESYNQNSTLITHQIPVRMKVNTAIAPTIVRHVAGSVVNTNSSLSPPKTIIKIPANNINTGLNHINTSEQTNKKIVHPSITQSQQKSTKNITVDPKYFLRQQTTNFNLQPIQDKSLKHPNEKRIVQRVPLHLDRIISAVPVTNLAQSVHKDCNKSNNSSCSYRQPVISFAVGKPITSINVSPQNQSHSHVQPVIQQPLLNRNINFRPKMRQTRYHTSTTNNDTPEGQDNKYAETLVSKMSAKAITINDREYKPLQFIKEKNAPIVSVSTALNKNHSLRNHLYRPVNVAVNSNVPTIINREDSEPKVFFNYTTVPSVIYVTPSLKVIGQPMNEQLKVASHNGSHGQTHYPLKYKNTQQHEVQTIIESKTVAVQMNDNKSSVSTNQLRQELGDEDDLQLLQQQLHNKLELKTMGSKNKSKTYTQRQNQNSHRNLARTFFEPSTESKITNTNKKSLHQSITVPNGKLKTNQRAAVTQPKQKHYEHAKQLSYNEHHINRVNLNGKPNIKSTPDHNKNITTQTIPNVKVVYSYLNQQPIKLNITTTVESHTHHVHVQPLPSHQMTEPRLTQESHHSIPQPQPQQVEFRQEARENHLLGMQQLYNRSMQMKSEDQVANFQQQNHEQIQAQQYENISYINYNNEILNIEGQSDVNHEDPQSHEYNHTSLPFYHQILEYEQQEHAYFKNQPKPQYVVHYQPQLQISTIISPSIQTNVIPQKVSSAALKDEVNAVLYDNTDYQHIQDGRNISDTYYRHNTFNHHPSVTNQNRNLNASAERATKVRVDRDPSMNKSLNDPIITNPGGIGFNISKRVTTSRIKQILAQEKIKRQDRQHSKTSYERFTSDKRDTSHNKVTMYIQGKQDDQQKLQESELYQPQINQDRAQQQVFYENAYTHQEPYFEENTYQQPSHTDKEQGFYAYLQPMQFVEEPPVLSSFYNDNVPFIHPQEVPMDQYEPQNNYTQDLDRYMAQKNQSSIQGVNQFESVNRNPEQVRLAEVPNETHHHMIKQISFGKYNNPIVNKVMESSIDKKPISYDDLRADLKNLAKKSHRTVQQHQASRRSSKQKTIEEKIRQKKSNFANLKEEAARVLGL